MESLLDVYLRLERLATRRMSGDIVAALVGRLDDREPETEGPRLAAVAMILKGREDPEVLLIKRAEKDGDPWSGQVALPGGKMTEGDASLSQTAERETLEEVGIDLRKSAQFLGYSGATRTHTGVMEVVPCAFLLREEVKVVPNDEVASYSWVKIQALLAPGAKSTYRLGGTGQLTVPAYSIGDYVVWGLTYRLLSQALEGAD